MISLNIFNYAKSKDKYAHYNGIYFKGKDLIPLFVKLPEFLTNKEKTLLIDFYKNNNRDLIKKLIDANKILPFAACIFRYLKCDQKYWDQLHSDFEKKNKKIKLILEDLFNKIKLKNIISLSVGENFGVVLKSNACMGCFCSGDVDIYADIAEKSKIISVLKYMGFYLKNRSKNSINYAHQVSMFHNKSILKTGFWINILWTTTSRAFLIQDSYDKRLVKERLISTTIGKTSIRVLNSTALLYFCTLHIACGHYYTLSPGIRLYVDIDRLCRYSKIDWDLIIKWSEEDNVGLRISLVMLLCYKLLKSPIPKIIYEKPFKKSKNKRLVNYLYNEHKNTIQNKSNKLSRLYIELLSDGKGLTLAITRRINYYFQKKIFRNRFVEN